jgi:tight adherence protein B
MDSTAFIRIGFIVCAAVAVVFFVEALYLAIARPLTRKRVLNRRLKVMENGVEGESTLVSLLAERGIDRGSFANARGLKRLLIQSGLRTTPSRFVSLMGLIFIGIFFALYFLTTIPPYIAVGIAGVFGFFFPMQFVRFARSRRQAAFSAQLPDALDVIVRSLRSGHPVPVALKMVGREMPDPVGSEFGLATDELTYGLDLSQALRNLAERVGVADLSLLVTAVSLQSNSGGNLGEVLSNLSKVLRDRFQLRRKVRSLSAEGRFSAYGLIILPAMIAGAIYVQNPGYFLDVWDEPKFLPGMALIAVWSLIGDFIMYKLINFKY